MRNKLLPYAKKLHDSLFCPSIKFIILLIQGRKKYGHALTFDDKMNKESLTKVMTPLLGLYADSKLKLKKLIKEMEEGEEGITIEKVAEQMVKKGIYISPN